MNKHILPKGISVRNTGARHNSVVEHLFMVQWVVGSMPHGGPIELFHFNQCSMTGITKAMVCAFLSIKISPCSGSRMFLSLAI